MVLEKAQPARMPRLLVALVAITMVGLLAGCGGEGDGRTEPAAGKGGKDVASLTSPGASATGSSAPGERPLIRPDSSSEEKERLWNAWERCLDEHGLGKRELDKEQASKQEKESERLCGSKQPEELWQRAQRTDPQYADKLRDWVTCIRSHGIDAWEDDGFLAFNSLPPDDQMRHVDECQAKAFNAG